MKEKQNSFLKNIFSLQRNPEYFNGKFHLLIFLINGIFLLFSIGSLITYIFYHVFGDLYIFSDRNVYEANQNLRTEYLQNYHNNDVSLKFNILNCFILLFLFLISKLMLKKQTYIHLFLYIGILKFFVVAYFMNFNITLIPHRNSFIYHIFNILLMIPYVLIMIHSFHHWRKSETRNGESISSAPLFEREKRETGMGKYRISNNNEQMSVDNIIDNVQLNMDMARIQFNSLMIKLGLGKLFKRFLFHKEDYYFMNKCKKENDKKQIFENITGKKKEKSKSCSKEQDSSDSNSTTCESHSSDLNGYSKLDEDNENNPLYH